MYIDQVCKNFSNLTVATPTKPVACYQFLHDFVCIILDVYTLSVKPLVTDFTSQPVVPGYFIAHCAFTF